MAEQEPLYADIDLTGFRAFLKYSGPDNDPALPLMELMLNAARRKVEELIGPLTPRTVVETVEVSGSGRALLTTWPIMRVDGVVRASTEQALTDLEFVMLSGGVLAVGRSNRGQLFTVTMTAGRSSIPSEVILATYVIGSHLWETQRGRGSRPQSYDGAAPVDVAPRGFAIPSRAEELLAGHRVPGVH